jgi:hypothetical protein
MGQSRITLPGLAGTAPSARFCATLARDSGKRRMRAITTHTIGFDLDPCSTLNPRGPAKQFSRPEAPPALMSASASKNQGISPKKIDSNTPREQGGGNSIPALCSPRFAASAKFCKTE